jgi:hypothetical protein
MNFEQVCEIMQPGDRVRRQTWGQNFYLLCSEAGNIHLRSSGTPKEAFNPIWAANGFDAHVDDFVLLTRLTRDQVYRRLYELTETREEVHQAIKQSLISRWHPEQLYWVDLNQPGSVLVRFNDAPTEADPIMHVDFHKKQYVTRF